MKKNRNKAGILIIILFIIGVIIFKYTSNRERPDEEFDIERHSLIYNGQSVVVNDYTITLLYEDRDNASHSNYCEFLITKNGGLDKIGVTDKARELSSGNTIFMDFHIDNDNKVMQSLNFDTGGCTSWTSKLKQCGNSIIVNAQFENASGLSGKIWVDDEKVEIGKVVLLQQISYLKCINAECENDMEIFLSPISVQLISPTLLFIDGMTLELEYRDGSKKELIADGIVSEYLMNHESVKDRRKEIYYQKWDFTEEKDTKNIVAIWLIGKSYKVNCLWHPLEID